MRWVGALLVCGACAVDHGANLADDLSVVMELDLSVPAEGDMVISRDAMTFPVPDLSRIRLIDSDLAWSSCAGTPLAGTCVADFFDAFVACFKPAGHCTPSSGNTNYTSWENGAYSTYDPMWQVGEHRMDASVCLQTFHYGGGWFDTGSDPFYHFCLGSDASCGHTYGLRFDWVPFGGARYDETTGVFTCTDGTQVQIGPMMGGCDTLNTLLWPHELCVEAGPP